MASHSKRAPLQGALHCLVTVLALLPVLAWCATTSTVTANVIKDVRLIASPMITRCVKPEKRSECVLPEDEAMAQLKGVFNTGQWKTTNPPPPPEAEPEVTRVVMFPAQTFRKSGKPHEILSRRQELPDDLKVVRAGHEEAESHPEYSIGDAVRIKKEIIQIVGDLAPANCLVLPGSVVFILPLHNQRWLVECVWGFDREGMRFLICKRLDVANIVVKKLHYVSPWLDPNGTLFDLKTIAGESSTLDAHVAKLLSLNSAEPLGGAPSEPKSPPRQHKLFKGDSSSSQSQDDNLSTDREYDQREPNEGPMELRSSDFPGFSYAKTKFWVMQDTQTTESGSRLERSSLPPTDFRPQVFLYYSFSNNIDRNFAQAIGHDFVVLRCDGGYQKASTDFSITRDNGVVHLGIPADVVIKQVRDQEPHHLNAAKFSFTQMTPVHTSIDDPKSSVPVSPIYVFDPVPTSLPEDKTTTTTAMSGSILNSIFNIFAFNRQTK